MSERDENLSTGASGASTEAAPKKKLKILRVKSNVPNRPDGGAPVALFERDPSHPRNGEAYVVGDIVAEVAATPAVVAALRDDRIVEVDEPVTNMLPPNLNLLQPTPTPQQLAALNTQTSAPAGAPSASESGASGGGGGGGSTLTSSSGGELTGGKPATGGGGGSTRTK